MDNMSVSFPMTFRNCSNFSEFGSSGGWFWMISETELMVVSNVDRKLSIFGEDTFDK